MREAVVGTVKVEDAVVHVVRGVGVNQIDDNPNAHRVSLVDEVLEVVGGAGPARDTEEAGNVVAERGVVRVLLDGHELNDVVAMFLDPIQVVISKVPVRANLALLLSHTNMCFVDTI